MVSWDLGRLKGCFTQAGRDSDKITPAAIQGNNSRTETRKSRKIFGVGSEWQEGN